MFARARGERVSMMMVGVRRRKVLAKLKGQWSAVPRRLKSRTGHVYVSDGDLIFLFVDTYP